MPKRSKKQIKNDENKILKELEKNANKSINEIAKKCNFSRQKVWRIIKRLEKNNTIWGYVTVVDTEKKEKNSYIILIKRTNKPADRKLANLITDRILEKKAIKFGIEIESSFYVNGNYDWIICINAESIKQVKMFIEAVNSTYEGYIKDAQILEKIFPIKRCGMINPNIDNLKEFTNL